MVSIDLHGTRHEEVVRKLENFIYEHMQKGTSEIRVITGKSAEMKKLVRNTIKDYGMTATDEWGNFGCLIIKMT
jgi:DNA-nicking Smr family endonuclease